MSQAKNVNTTSRRAVLAGIAAAPALAGPALAVDDAELVRLGRELAELIPEPSPPRRGAWSASFFGSASP